MDKIKELISGISFEEFTTREWKLLAVCTFLAGVVIGIFCSPKKKTMIGNNNGYTRISEWEPEEEFEYDDF